MHSSSRPTVQASDLVAPQRKIVLNGLMGKMKVVSAISCWRQGKSETIDPNQPLHITVQLVKDVQPAFAGKSFWGKWCEKEAARSR